MSIRFFLECLFHSYWEGPYVKAVDTLLASFLATQRSNCKMILWTNSESIEHIQVEMASCLQKSSRISIRIYQLDNHLFRGMRICRIPFLRNLKRECTKRTIFERKYFLEALGFLLKEPSFFFTRCNLSVSKSYALQIHLQQ